MTVRKITITDHSPEQGELRPEQILEIEIKGQDLSVHAVTEAICNTFKNKWDHAVLVEDISRTRNVIYSKEAWKNA